MKNFFDNILNKKKEVEATENQNNEEFNLFKHILENGNVLYLNNDFDKDNFIETIKKYMKEDLELSTQTKSQDNVYQIDYENKKGIKKSLGVSGKFTLFMIFFEQELIFIIKPNDWIKNPDEKESFFNVSSWFEDSYENELKELFTQKVTDEIIASLEPNKIDFNNTLIEKIPANQQTWFYTVQDEGEIMLGCSHFHSIKELPDNIELDDDLDLKIIFTTQKLVIVGFNNVNDIRLFVDISDFKIELKKGILKHEVILDKIKLAPGKKTIDFLSDIQDFKNKDAYTRIKNIAKINYKNKSFDYTKSAINLIIKDKNSFYDKLILFYINMKTESLNLSDNENDIELYEILKGIINDENLYNKISEIYKDWNFSYTDKSVILQLFTQISINETQKNNIKELYSEIRTEFLKTSKDAINKTVFEINYSRFLIDLGKNEDAVKILNDLLKHLPDESVMDILPDAKQNIADSSSGQTLKITILDLLVEAKGKEKSHDEILKTAQLQPLNKERIEAVISNNDSEISARANILFELLFTDKFPENHEASDNYELNVLPKKKFENTLRHPATQKNGGFYAIQKWVSKVKGEDYSAVKSFSERLNPKEHEKLFKHLSEIKKSFDLFQLEFYIARGEKSIGITGYEGEPPFVVIGYDHLDTNSEFHLTIDEIKFLVASEISHIYFKHTPITSSDVWRGVAEKGHLFLDTLLTVIPAIGLLGKSLQTVSKLSSVSKIMKLSEKVKEGGELITGALAISNFYKKTNKKETNEKEQELLALSRLMQYTADRAGLVYSGDVKSAIRAIMLSGKFNYKYIEKIIKSGLYELITEKNSDETYKNQDIALRIGNLFSFYLSDDYFTLRKTILKNINPKNS